MHHRRVDSMFCKSSAASEICELERLAWRWDEDDIDSECFLLAHTAACNICIHNQFAFSKPKLSWGAVKLALQIWKLMFEIVRFYELFLAPLRIATAYNRVFCIRNIRCHFIYWVYDWIHDKMFLKWKENIYLTFDGPCVYAQKGIIPSLAVIYRLLSSGFSWRYFYISSKWIVFIFVVGHFNK